MISMSTDIEQSKMSEMWSRAKAIYLSSIFDYDEKSLTESYLDMVTSVKTEGGSFIIYASSDFVARLLGEKYADKLKSSLTLAGVDPELKIEFKYDSNSKPAGIMHERVVASVQSKKTELATSTEKKFVSTQPLNEIYTFDEFVEGPSNSWALAAAKGVVENPGAVGYNPLFIHGGTGLGKTHLMQAIGNELLKRRKNISVCYLTAETFLNEYVNAMQNGNGPEFRYKYRNVDVLLLDDVQFLQKGKMFQEEFFNTFNTLTGARKQIVLTSDVAPKNLTVLEERLISRFEGGLVQEIESPTYETRLAILRKKAEGSNPPIPDLAIRFIAEKIKSHVRAMEGALGKVRVSLTFAKPDMLNADFLTKLLKDFIEKEQAIKKVTIEDIQEYVINKFNITKENLLSGEKLQIYVAPRQLAMYVARKCTTKTLNDIADAFKKTHATVLHGTKSIEAKLKTDEKTRVQLKEMLDDLGLSILE